MFKILNADKDTYITDKAIQKARKVNSNVGSAGTLDLFKVYGAFFSGTFPQAEKSRLLIHFDLSHLKSMFLDGKLDINDASFWCKMHLKDVYGGQTTPENFTVSVFPLSSSFDEGTGRDSSYFSDTGISNWLSSSLGTEWHITGCYKSGSSNDACDYITGSSGIGLTEVKQFFKTGDEDLVVDVTRIVSATLSGELPDRGFRISYEKSLEDDSQTYFVKRFASRTAYDESKRPKLLVGYDDSISDDSQNFVLDSSNQMTLYNYVRGDLSNITSGSSQTPVTGSDCLLLKLTTAVSGGTYSLFFTGSQHKKCFPSGTYVANVTVSSYDTHLTGTLLASSSIDFTPVWTSLDGTVAFVTGSSITARLPSRKSTKTRSSHTITVQGLNDVYDDASEVIARLHVFDQTNPLFTVTKVPVEMPGLVLKEAHYQIRNSVTDEIVVAYDTNKGSTRISSDSLGMFFKFSTEDLPPGRTYVIDILTIVDGTRTKYFDVSPVFRVETKE